MKAKLILPSLTEAESPFFRPIKYSLFPPLGLATLAAYFSANDDVQIVDEHVERLSLEDTPDLVVIQVYITNAYRAYRIADAYRARGITVVLGGLHVTSLPEEAAAHADAIFLGPGEATFPAFLARFRAGLSTERRYQSSERSLDSVPPVRRDLIRRERYLVPNSLVVSRGCPHHCDFCYKDAFFEGGRGFYTQRVDAALAEIERLPGAHLYFLDDHLFGNPRFASALFDGMRGMGRLFQGAATVDSILRPGLLEKAVAAGLRSLFVGFESLSAENLGRAGKRQNLGRDYDLVIRRLDELGVLINGSFVFGLDDDDDSVFDRTVEFAVSRGLTTATFHIATPYPGTGFYQRIEAEGRLLTQNWDRYDTRHAVFEPRGLTTQQLEDGYWRAYRDFYGLRNIARASLQHASVGRMAKHFAYSLGWKKFEPAWDWVIRSGALARARPLLESILATVRPVGPTRGALDGPADGARRSLSLSSPVAAAATGPRPRPPRRLSVLPQVPAHS